MKRLLLVLFAVCLLLPAVGAAQAQPVNMDVRVGLGGATSGDAWFPVTITVANSGNDLTGTVTWRWQGGGMVYAQVVDLPQGSRKQIVLPVRNTNWSRRATVQVVANNRVWAEQVVPVEPLDQNQTVLGVVDDTGAAFASLAGLRPQGPQLRVVQLTLAELPERPELLQTLSALLLTGDTSTLQPAQRTALEGWVLAGGQLIINGGRPQIAAGLGDLAPAEVGNGSQTRPLGEVLRQQLPLSPTVDVALLPLTPEQGTAFERTADGLVWLVRQQHGHGTISQSAWDLARAGSAQELVWTRYFQPRQEGGPRFGRDDWRLLQPALTLPALRLPSLLALLGFLLLYVLLVGPVNYLLLRRWDRREWAYLTIPLTVLAFTGAAYGWGARGRGSRAIANELTMIRTASGATVGQATTEVGLFSPSRQSYTLGFPPDALVSDDEGGFRRTADPVRTIRTETTVEVPDVLVDVGELRSFVMKRTVAVPALEVRRQGAEVVVRNTSNQPVEDVILVRGTSVRGLKDLAPGAEARVGLPQDDFFQDAGLPQLGLRQEGTINREAVVRNLIERQGFVGMPTDMFAPGAVEAIPAAVYPAPTPFAVLADRSYPGPEETVPPAPMVPSFPAFGPPDQFNRLYLLAWLPQASTPLRVNGTPVDTQGDTLMIVEVAP